MVWCKSFIIAIFFSVALFLLSSQSSAQSEIPLDPEYCGGTGNDYYVIPGEQQCSRSPNACGNGYDELNVIEKMPDPNTCVGQGAPAGKTGCDGYVPVCCYEVARTGDFTKCVGYWERLWCAPSQCQTALSNGASEAQCGGSCQCGHAFGTYCGADKQPVALSTRLGVATTPTATPTSAISSPTPTPGDGVPTNTPTPTPEAVDCAVKKLVGDYNCNNAVEANDFDAWKTDFAAGKTTLAYFEYFRRAFYQ